MKLIGYILTAPFVLLLLFVNAICFTFISVIGFPFFLGASLISGGGLCDVYKGIVEIALFPLEVWKI